MTKKICGGHWEQIGAETSKKWKRKRKAKYDLVEKIQNQNGVIFFENRSSVVNWISTILDRYYTCKYSLNNHSMHIFVLKCCLV